MTLPVPTKEAMEESTRKPLQSLTWQRMQECRMGILMNHLGGEGVEQRSRRRSECA